MKLLSDCWVAVLGFFNAVTLSPIHDEQSSQHVLDIINPSLGSYAGDGGPSFRPPGHPQKPEDDVLQCDYKPMGPLWKPCSTNHSRSCWLAGPAGQQYDINTDYETKWPTGVVRKYHLVADEMNITADGVLNPYGKAFNGRYPGPWIQACWGDILEITVTNRLSYNGTAVHWHGIRQLQSLEMDGIPGVTQCPIAPGDSFTYRFRATQYGTSWYHSHYSLQYGDGLAGPLTIHGPSAADYDEPKDPILMTDWNHRSAFQDFQIELGGAPPLQDSILLNGLGMIALLASDSIRELTVVGSYAGGAGGLGIKYNTTFERGKKYLLRLINHSVDTTFVFAIDNHNVTVMSSDFVPIHPYVTDHVVIGIGQRYNVVVEALPKNPDGTPNHSEAFWMRTIPAPGCANFQPAGVPDERQGIVYYKKGSTAYPFTQNGTYDVNCRDEPYVKLRPIIPWQVPAPANIQPAINDELFEVGGVNPVPGQGHPLPSDLFFRWAIGPRNLYLNYSEPTIMNLNNKQWNPDYVVIPKDYPEGSWVYMVIYGNTSDVQPTGRQTIPAAHPIHLHGHDFVLLHQSNTPYSSQSLSQNLKLDNPPRRDVVLLPTNGYVVIAFRADNPGSWLLHCHIAMHASSGLAMQILERQEALQKQIGRPVLESVEKTCAKWDRWFSDERNLWGANRTFFQDDSGI
ncbi:MAG: hypothetical protein Q9220_005493 [cf. Caloplaca sp. 1 TL-2023]